MKIIKCPNCHEEFEYRWQNNLFNERINGISHKFSLCDIDGLVHRFYDNNIRLVIFETKRNLENCSLSQIRALTILKNSIDWQKFDNKSGVFLIEGLDDTFQKTKIYEIDNNQKKYIKTVDFEYYKDWFYDG